MTAITKQQWLDKLSSEKLITIKPYDPHSEIIFEKLEKIFYKNFKNLKIYHRGSSYLKISGQDEIDVYIPVSPQEFNSYIPKVSAVFGEVRSCYDLQRCRFSYNIDNKHIDLFLINKLHSDWIDGTKFENFLKSNSEFLKKYEKLKLKYDGKSVKDYYTAKNKFIENILKKLN